MKTVVSLTPLPLDRDSRTLKIAQSLARLGYRSVVVENRPSAPGRDLGAVTVVTLGRSAGRGGEDASRGEPAALPAIGGAARDDLAPRLRRIFRPLVPAWLRERVHYGVFVLAYFIWRPLLGLLQVPRADLYYLHEYRLFPTVWLLLRVRGRVPVLYDAHDIYQEVEAEGSLSPFWRRRFLPLLGRMERWAVRHAAAVVTVGAGVAERIAVHVGKPCFVLRNCHDSRLERPSPWSLRARSGVGPYDILVVVIGNRKPGQAIEPLIVALAGLPATIHVAFVGRAYDDVEAMAVRHGVAGRVHPVGPVPPECIVPCVREADLAALLYWPETENVRHILPNGFFQSLSAGLPLLYPSLPELERIIAGRSVGRVVDPRDVGSLSRALASLSADPAERGRLAAEAARLGAELGWQHEEERLAALVAGGLDGREWPW